MKGEAKIGIMLASTEVQLARRDGFRVALKAVPSATVVADGDGRNILERATAEAENMLTAHPDINVIYATGDPQLQGGLAAAASQGRDIAFFGWDDIPQPFLKPLEDGRIKGFLKQISRRRWRDGGPPARPTSGGRADPASVYLQPVGRDQIQPRPVPLIIGRAADRCGAAHHREDEA